MDHRTKEQVTKKIHICYMMAKECLPFTKYPSLHQLEVSHGVDLGTAYQTDVAAKSFTHYIAESQRKHFLSMMSSEVHFFSFLLDGTTDAGNVEDEMVLIQFCRQDDTAKEMKSCARYISVFNPDRADTDGLVSGLQKTLEKILGISDTLDKSSVLSTRPVLVGGGSDGASVNIAHHKSIRERFQKSLPWMFWSWCFSHRLELASKNGLTSRLFKAIEEMLLRLYYLYKKSPKKTRELSVIVEELKEVFELPESGNIPIRSEGSRWITHKRRALQRVLDRYGAYLSHLNALAEDNSIQAEDRARIKGYCRKWSEYKILVGCALYAEVLKPPSILSLALQTSSADIVYSIKQILKATSAMKSLREKDPLQWPAVQKVMTNIHSDANGEKIYEGVFLNGFSDTIVEQCKKDALSDLKCLAANIVSRLEWSNLELLRAFLVFLDTQRWIKRSNEAGSDDSSLDEIKHAIEEIYQSFMNPLEAQSVTLFILVDEIEDTVDYARSYLTLETTDYRKIWYSLHVCPESHKWKNILFLCELVFSLPFSNARVEQTFSSLKIIKSNNRTCLNTGTLDDLLEIHVEGPPYKDFSADSALEMWWKDTCTSRRPCQAARKPYQPRCTPARESGETSSTSSNFDEQQLTLDEWDELFVNE